MTNSTNTTATVNVNTNALVDIRHHGIFNKKVTIEVAGKDVVTAPKAVGDAVIGSIVGTVTAAAVLGLAKSATNAVMVVGAKGIDSLRYGRLGAAFKKSPKGDLRNLGDIDEVFDVDDDDE